MKKFLLLATCLTLLLPGIVQAKALNIATIERPPFAFQENETWDGYSLELLANIAQLQGWTIKLQPETEFKTMINNVQNNIVDGAIANISITAARETTMDYSLPIFNSGLQIASTKNSSGLSIINVILNSGLLWYVLIALGVLLIAGHVIWWLERKGGHDYFRDSYREGIWDGFWWAFVLVIAGGFEDKVPHRFFSRMFAVFWMIMSLFFVSIIVAQITTALTVSELSSSIEGLEDLYGKRVATIEGSTADIFLQGKNITPVYAESFKEMMENLKAKKYDAVMHDSPLLNYYTITEGEGLIQTIGEPLNTEPFGMLFPENSILREQFNLGLLTLYENGKYRTIYERWFGQ